MAALFTVSADYPGGNIIVDDVIGDIIYLHQDLRDTEGWWFYWNFFVSGAQGRTLRFEFTNGNVIGTRGPAFTRDGGQTWEWLGTGCETVTEKGSSFEFPFGEQDSAVQFAFSIPYLQSDLEAFLGDFPDVRSSVLCNSLNGRAVECLHVQQKNLEAKYRVFLTARHHACEAMADYVLEGIFQRWMQNDNIGQWLQNQVDLWAVPFADKDGVEQGDQGKNRRPRDHNRDYAEPSIYAETNAIKEMVSHWDPILPAIAIDLHCPHIRGPHNESIYIVGSAYPVNQAAQRRLSLILESEATGELPYRDATFLPFGTSWNVALNYSQGLSCSSWMSEQEHIMLATTFEIPYAAADEVTVSRKNARQFGHDIARALHTYMANLPAEKC